MSDSVVPLSPLLTGFSSLVPVSCLQPLHEDGRSRAPIVEMAMESESAMDMDDMSDNDNDNDNDALSIENPVSTKSRRSEPCSARPRTRAYEIPRVRTPPPLSFFGGAL